LLVSVWRHGTLVLEVGSWPATFGITLAVDPLSAAMVAVTAVVAVPVMLYAETWLPTRLARGGFRPLAFLMLAGVSLAFVTGDLFNLYVAFEVLLVSSFGLMALGGKPEQVRGTTSYVFINLVASAFFLGGVAALYGLTGTLNLADMSVRLAGHGSPSLVLGAAMLLLVAFGIKAAVFPLFFWLPASYHTPPVPVAALFAGLLTKVGVYALIRVFSLLLAADLALIQPLLLGTAALTMIAGVLGAAAQSDIRRILSWHIISQIGYMVMGLALATPLALVGAVFYVVHHIVVKTNLFLVGGLISRSGGDFELDRLGGLYRSRPGLALLFLVPALSLAGLPPLSGFWAKLILLRAGLEAGQYWIVAVAAVVGLLTLYSMTKIWAGAFWSPAPDSQSGVHGPLRLGLWLPVVALAGVTLFIGLWAEPLIELAERAAASLIDPAAYVTDVLGAAR
ncbi:MAG: proton-conducting transporter membrane subunit, partial [Gemmatimonadota bacterium]